MENYLDDLNFIEKEILSYQGENLSLSCLLLKLHIKRPLYYYYQDRIKYKLDHIEKVDFIQRLFTDKLDLTNYQITLILNKFKQF